MSANKRKPKSPMWRNPRDMIKRHLKRKSSRCLITEAVALPSSSASVSDTLNSSDGAKILEFNRPSSRVFNPFKHSSPLKKIDSEGGNSGNELLRCSSESALCDFPSGIFDVIKQREASNDTERRVLKGLQTSDFPPIDFSSFTSNLSRDTHIARTEQLPERKVSKALPLDLRLGTKVRIESKSPFSWMRDDDQPGNYQVRITGVESDAAIHVARHLVDSGQEVPLPSVVNLNSMARLEASTLYWQFPNIPWISAFPRLDAARKFVGIRKEKAPSISSLGKLFAESLDGQWVSAFSHLFFSWKKGDRRSFYLCCPAFTAFFTKIRKEGSAETDEDTCSTSSWANKYILNVIITPTTSGFRQQLREEGILFELPLRQYSRRSSHEPGGIYFGFDGENTMSNDVSQSSLTSSSLGQSRINVGSSVDTKESLEKESNAGSDDENDTSGDSDSASWLQEIGVSPRLKKTLTRNLSLSSNNERSLMDSAMTEMTQQSASHLSPSSDVSKTVVLISDSVSIQRLFNFLNESKACHPSAGPSAGLPPTLLSVEPFLHSTLKNLTKFSQIVKSNKNELKYVCELSNGPIMPHMISQLQLFFAECPTLRVPGNRLKVQVYGKNFCAALNQASHIDGTYDYNSFEYVVDEGLYYLD